MKDHKKVFQAKSNYIVLEDVGKNIFIKKKYKEKLATYDVKWPLSRCKAERETLLLLEKRLRHCDSLAVPHIYQSVVPVENTIEMEYIDGRTIYELMSEAYANPMDTKGDPVCTDMPFSAHQFQALFQFLYELREIKVDDLSKEFREVLHRQSPIVCCMYHHKLKDQIGLVHDGQGVFCLGDLSIHNIICRQNKLYLIDFECVHFGYNGYDIGQLLGMCRAYSEIFSAAHASKMYDMIEAGFRLFVRESDVPDAYVRQCEWWRERFCEYYNKEYNT